MRPSRRPFRRRPRLVLLLAAAAGAGCVREQAAPVIVLAAASTADAVAEIAEQYERKTGTAVEVSSGPSNGLARQVLAGAPADLFLSASEEWADAVSKGGRAAEVKPLLSNRLVMIVPKGNPGRVTGPTDLTSDRVRRVALAGEEVPAGRYADAVLARLDLTEPLKASGKIVRGHDVRATTAVVARGEAEVGIVYATDATASDAVTVVHTFDPAQHPPIVYPVVLIRGGPAGDAGRRFYDHLFSDAAAETFRRHGFLPASEAQP